MEDHGGRGVGCYLLQYPAYKFLSLDPPYLCMYPTGYWYTCCDIPLHLGAFSFRSPILIFHRGIGPLDLFVMW